MSLGINLLMYLTEIASKSLGNNFLSKVYEVHHKPSDRKYIGKKVLIKFKTTKTKKEISELIDNCLAKNNKKTINILNEIKKRMNWLFWT